MDLLAYRVVCCSMNVALIGSISKAYFINLHFSPSTKVGTQLKIFACHDIRIQCIGIKRDRMLIIFLLFKSRVSYCVAPRSHLAQTGHRTPIFVGRSYWINTRSRSVP